VGKAGGEDFENMPQKQKGPHSVSLRGPFQYMAEVHGNRMGPMKPISQYIKYLPAKETLF